MNGELFTDPMWKAVLDAIPQGLVAVDRDGKVVYFNPYAEMALGIRANDAIDHHFRDVFCPSLPMSQCWINLALEASETIRGHRFEMEQPGGRRRELEADLTPSRDRNGDLVGGIVSIHLVDGSEPLVEKLDHARETREAILGSIADGLFTVDHEWRITSFNRAAERLTGFKESEVVGKFCRQVLCADRCRERCPLAIALERHENLFDHEVVLTDRTGQPKPVVANSAGLYNRTGDPIGGVVSFRDVSLLQKLRDDLRSTTHFEGLVGKHKKMQDIYQLIAEVADSDAAVLFMGESGTGKEMVADALVRRSHRRDMPYIRVNCSVFPEGLLESELFGHVEGAFAAARQDRFGRFELADGGTVFLDEIGEISPAVQVKLLRLLENKEFSRVGSTETIKVDVRVIAATNQDLPRLVEEKRFRDDLYYRLNVIPMVLPPLRERRSDIPLLLDHFMAKLRLITGKPIETISDRALDLLMIYDYPGNVRELESALEHAFARTSGSVITEEKLPLSIRQQLDGGSRSSHSENGDDEYERIRGALERAHWNRNRAARLLGISRITLWRRMKALDMLDRQAKT